MHTLTEPLDILQVIGAVATRYGGPAKVVKEMSRSLAERGHRVNLVTTDADWGSHLNLPLEKAVRVDGYSMHVSHCQWPKPPHLSLKFSSAVRKFGGAANVAHVHGVFDLPAITAFITLENLGTPYVVRACGALDRHGLTRRGVAKRFLLRTFERRYLDRAMFIQASTEREKSEIEAWNLGAPIEVIAQGVEKPQVSKESRCIDKPYLLCLGRLAKKKGIDIAIAALKHVLNEIPDLRLVVAGSDERGYQAELKMLAAAHQLGENVMFVGLVEGENKTRWLRDAEALVLPSLDENFGVVVVEAAALGTPVVVSPNVALSVEIEADGAGMVVSRDSEAVASSLLEVVRSGKARWHDGCARFAARFDWSTSAARLEQAYRRGMERLEPKRANG